LQEPEDIANYLDAYDLSNMPQLATGLTPVPAYGGN
jgi:hypothetical protein